MISVSSREHRGELQGFLSVIRIEAARKSIGQIAIVGRSHLLPPLNYSPLHAFKMFPDRHSGVMQDSYLMLHLAMK
jgi:hypothetical protein